MSLAGLGIVHHVHVCCATAHIAASRIQPDLKGAGGFSRGACCLLNEPAVGEAEMGWEEKLPTHLRAAPRRNSSLLRAKRRQCPPPTKLQDFVVSDKEADMPEVASGSGSGEDERPVSGGLPTWKERRPRSESAKHVKEVFTTCSYFVSMSFPSFFQLQSCSQNSCPGTLARAASAVAWRPLEKSIGLEEVMGGSPSTKGPESGRHKP